MFKVEINVLLLCFLWLADKTDDADKTWNKTWKWDHYEPYNRLNNGESKIVFGMVNDAPRDRLEMKRTSRRVTATVH